MISVKKPHSVLKFDFSFKTHFKQQNFSTKLLRKANQRENQPRFISSYGKYFLFEVFSFEVYMDLEKDNV